MPPRLFKNVGFVAIIVIATIGSMVYYSLTILWPTIIGTVYTTDSIKIGLQSSVVGGGVLLGQAFGGMAISFVPRLKIQAVVAACMAMAFITPLVTLTPDSWAMTIALGTLGCIGKLFFPALCDLSPPLRPPTPSSLSSKRELTLSPKPSATSRTSPSQA